MTSIKQTKITRDLASKRILVVREFDAPLELVWKAWTDSSLLDSWWAPKPWKAVTKSMDFREGGTWLYFMKGPDGTGSWCLADFKKIIPQKSYTGDDGFCDENGVINRDFPVMHWNVGFSATATGTMVKVEITFDSQADMEKIVEMGFEEGFTAAHGNLDELLETL